MNTAFKALDDSKLTKQHWFIWILSAMGVCLDGFDLFIIAVALPLIAVHFHASPVMLGLIGASTPIGCIFGAIFLGRLTDHLGRKTMLLVNLMFFVVFAGLSAFSWDVYSLIAFRFLLGIGIGADYPVTSTYMTENMPKRIRGKMIVSGFGFQAIGALSGALVGILILKLYPQMDAWRWMLGIAVFPAIIILSLRTLLPESPRWLMNKGKTDKANKITAKLTKKQMSFDTPEFQLPPQRTSFWSLFKKPLLQRTILTSVAWMLMDVALYSMGFFTTIILAAMAFKGGGHGDFIAKDILATEGTALLDIFLVLGIVFAVMLVDKLGRIKLQYLGFIGMAIGLAILAASSLTSGLWHLILIFGGFGLFNLLVNMGPNPTTYLLPAELFPTHIRSTGHGFASASGKVGAAIGIFILPILKAHIGLPETLVLMSSVCLLGAIVTLLMGHETKGKSLENLSESDYSRATVRDNLERVSDEINHLNNKRNKATT